MRSYDIVAVLWEDHTSFYGSALPKNPDELIEIPILSVGFLYKETDKTVTIVSEVVPATDVDEAHFTIIRKDAIVGIERYGSIRLKKFRR